MSSKAKRPPARPPVADEIEREVRNARHYLALLRDCERSAEGAYDAGDLPALQRAKDEFQRELGSCLNAARTAKNYLIGAATAAGQRIWVETRLAPPTYKFHADIAGNAFHERAIRLSRMVGVNISIGSGSAQFEMVHGPDGSIDMKPLTNNVQKAPMRYIYDVTDLDAALSAQLNSVTSQPRAIIDLLDEYIDGLEHALKNGVRNGRFMPTSASSSATP